MTNVKSIEDKMAQVAVLLGDKLTFSNTQGTTEISLNDIPAESIAHLLQYGCRKANDIYNSGKGNIEPEKLGEYWNSIMDRIREGKLGERKVGGIAGDEFRAWLLTWFKAQGTPTKVIKSFSGLTAEAIIKQQFKGKAEQVEIRLRETYAKVCDMMNLDF